MFLDYIANRKETCEAYYELKFIIYQDPELMACRNFLITIWHVFIIDTTRLHPKRPLFTNLEKILIL